MDKGKTESSRNWGKMDHMGKKVKINEKENNF